MFLKKVREFFSWHLLPEEPIKIKSVVEIVIFFLVAWGLIFLFITWNEVPIRHIKIYSEAINYRDDFNNDSVHYLPYRVLRFRIPTTDNKELVKDSVRLYIKQGFFQYEQVRNTERWKIIIGGGVCGYARESSILESFKSKYCPQYSGENLMWDSIVMNRPYYTSPFSKGNTIVKKELTGDTLHPVYYDACVNDTLYWRTYYGYKFRYNYDVNEMSGKESTSITSGMNIFSYLYDIIFGSGTQLEIPRWGRLEDISQAYYDVELVSASVDSIRLCFDFMGAVDFSKMTPEPDIESMNYIEFNDIRKIKEIKNSGLKFHVVFKELAIRQEIRLFFVTAILSGLFTVFLGFIILGTVKFNRTIGNTLKETIKYWKDKKKQESQEPHESNPDEEIIDSSQVQNDNEEAQECDDENKVDVEDSSVISEKEET